MAIAALGPIVGLLGTAVSAYGTIAGANAQSAALDYQAKVARIKATQEQATAQRGALESKRKADLAQSTLQARAAASGAGASDPTVVDLAGDIGARGRYQSGLQMWQGQERGWDYTVDANAKEAQADTIRSVAPLSAFGTILGGAGSIFKAYGKSGFSPASTTDDTDYSYPYWING
jgi:hypothetical protein